ncbi:unnamed protein product [Owenia fusiformis]|uniref:Sulfotransferase domain-containing protein n=1 Tax=Owenia fusiformis TaxID=6347 RepID=A0A8S4PWM0_OWEFU|nr:unnamed protein product [Owenia fusiformis]
MRNIIRGFIAALPTIALFVMVVSLAGLLNKPYIVKARHELNEQSSHNFEDINEEDYEEIYNEDEDDDIGEISEPPRNCLPLHFSPVALPHIALVSVPGSGNTWARHLIQQATGIYTGSMYKETNIDKTIFPNRPFNNSVIVMKRHTRWSVGTPIVKSILLVRNPMDAFVAAYNRIKSNKTGHAPKSLFHSEDWRTFVTDRGSKWLLHGVNWLAFPYGPVHVVKFENLQSNLKEELRKICIFLDHPASEETLNCAVRNAEGAYKRNRTETDRSIFPERLLKKLESDILFFDYITEGYEKLNREKYHIDNPKRVDYKEIHMKRNS